MSTFERLVNLVQEKFLVWTLDFKIFTKLDLKCISKSLQRLQNFMPSEQELNVMCKTLKSLVSGPDGLCLYILRIKRNQVKIGLVSKDNHFWGTEVYGLRAPISSWRPYSFGSAPLRLSAPRTCDPCILDPWRLICSLTARENQTLMKPLDFKPLPLVCGV